MCLRLISISQQKENLKINPIKPVFIIFFFWMILWSLIFGKSFKAHDLFRKSQYILAYQKPWNFCSKKVENSFCYVNLTQIHLLIKSFLPLFWLKTYHFLHHFNTSRNTFLEKAAIGFFHRKMKLEGKYCQQNAVLLKVQMIW